MTPRLNICLVSETWPPEVNGVAMTMARLADGLRHRGHAVHIVRPRQGNEDGGSTGETLVRSLPLPGYKDLQIGMPSDRVLRELWARDRPDVVHAVTEGPLGWSALRIAHLLGIPVTSSYHTHFDGYSKHYGASLIGPIISAWLRIWISPVAGSIPYGVPYCSHAWGYSQSRAAWIQVSAKSLAAATGLHPSY